jgi:hypothetical protein
MGNVTQYVIMFNGSTDGYLGMRAQIQLKDGTTSLGYVRFYDPNKTIPADSISGTAIIMNLPSSMLQIVIDVLRNEQPINFYLAAGSGSASINTSIEPVGEGES